MIFTDLEAGRDVFITPTSFKGHLYDVTYDELIAIFGEPAEEIDYKFRWHWQGKCLDENGNSVVFTIYDWNSRVPKHMMRNWNVGGTNIHAVYATQYFIEQSRKSLNDGTKEVQRQGVGRY